ncbi:unnamed protein product [Didymodactylos carnosus]|uniref:Doublecortin domain-containing protein n=1 Tax=Didymodactylos carnosus TaxID=1234261 RepID=A0A815CDK2_9BILA|nr:unnamed protein product [Didymodactylos carnosus]CAF1282677.1 unnamed protein product [Didymodactylos carnosus]CAF3979941.1 unnamed protein product [Didymodactylos carnosus]CAF4079323.1 unnamed protein product [Didymodactylos carnosus]
MPRRARRLFNANGNEILSSEDIQRDMEYCVSSGEKFKNPLKTIAAKPSSPIDEKSQSPEEEEELQPPDDEEPRIRRQRHRRVSPKPPRSGLLNTSIRSQSSEEEPQQPDGEKPRSRRRQRRQVSSKPKPTRSRPLSAPTRTVPLYKRRYRSTNFRVRVYRNNDPYRHVYCKSCTMDTILTAATQKLRMSMGARHLYDSRGREVHCTEDIQHNRGYYVS